MNKEKIKRLEEIKKEIRNLVDEAINSIRESGEYTRAKGYWYYYIRTSLDNTHGMWGEIKVTMQDSIDIFKEMEEE